MNTKGTPHAHPSTYPSGGHRQPPLSALVLAGCSSATESEDSAADEQCRQGTGAVGFIMVGPKDDFGYNQAVYEAARSSSEEFPDLEVLTAENVPEDDTAATTMEQMIDEGAKIIFATSYGHLDAAQQGGRGAPRRRRGPAGQHHRRPTSRPNSGTYFGTVYEPMYLAGIAAGAATESDKLGYVYAFPIPQTIANINAFQRGAQSVNPGVETITVSTSSAGATPASSRPPPRACSRQGVDVLTQHQDCTSTVIQAAEAGGRVHCRLPRRRVRARPRGLADRRGLGLGPALHRHRPDRARRRLHRAASSTTTSASATRPAPTRSSSPTSVRRSPTRPRRAIDEAQAWLATDEGSPFARPGRRTRTATVAIEDGLVPTYAENDAMDFFVQGVVGNLAQ